VFAFQCSIGTAKEISIDLDQKLRSEVSSQQVLAKVKSFNEWLELYRTYLTTPGDHILLADQFTKENKEQFLKAVEPYKKDGSFKLPDIKERGDNIVAKAGNIELRFKLKDLVIDHEVKINGKPYKLEKDKSFDDIQKDLKELLEYKEASRESKFKYYFNSFFGIHEAEAAGLMALLAIITVGAVLTGLMSWIWGGPDEDEIKAMLQDLNKAMEAEVAACSSKKYTLSDTLERANENRGLATDSSFTIKMTEKIFGNTNNNTRLSLGNPARASYLNCLDTINAFLEFNDQDEVSTTTLSSSPFREEIVDLCGDKNDSEPSGLHWKLENCLKKKAATSSFIEQENLKRGMDAFKNITPGSQPQDRGQSSAQ
jgi:hypothetical protein